MVCVVVCGVLLWFVVVCGGLWWFAVVSGGLWYLVPPQRSKHRKSCD